MEVAQGRIGSWLVVLKFLKKNLYSGKMMIKSKYIILINSVTETKNNCDFHYYVLPVILFFSLNVWAFQPICGIFSVTQVSAQVTLSRPCPHSPLRSHSTRRSASVCCSEYVNCCHSDAFISMPFAFVLSYF